MSAIHLTPVTSPVSLVIDVCDVEERYPSVKLSVELIAPHPTGRFAYTANDIWFSATVLDQFISSLTLVADARNEAASLADLSDYVQLTVVNADGNYSMTFRAHEPKTGLTTGDMSISTTIDRDIVQFMLSAFRNLPPLQRQNAK